VSRIIPWTDRQTAVALQMDEAGLPHRLIGERLGRTAAAVGAELARARKEQQEAAFP
jgi:DNA-directed RNA polymerase specialized sigma24 family protein